MTRLTLLILVSKDTCPNPALPTWTIKERLNRLESPTLVMRNTRLSAAGVAKTQVDLNLNRTRLQ